MGIKAQTTLSAVPLSRRIRTPAHDRSQSGRNTLRDEVFHPGAAAAVPYLSSSKIEVPILSAFKVAAP